MPNPDSSWVARRLNVRATRRCELGIGADVRYDSALPAAHGILYLAGIPHENGRSEPFRPRRMAFMKQYVIDQLRESDFTRILEYLDQHAEPAGLDAVFRLPLPEELHAPHQVMCPKCGAFYFGVTLTYKQVAFELLVRSADQLRCGCIGYANPDQRAYVIDFADKMLEELNIRL